MKEILIIYNPNAGHGTAQQFAYDLKKEFVSKGTRAILFRSNTIKDMNVYFDKLKKTNKSFDTIVFLGGDGTLGIGVDSMIKKGIDSPVAIFPLGTVNDFSKQVHMKRNVKKCVQAVLNGNIRNCDVAKVNDRYVVNVACGGYFTHGANTYSRRAKQVWGRMAYYTKGALNVFNMKPQKLRITVDDKVYEEDIVFYSILNSKSAGGFKKLGVHACMDDGMFDFVGIKNIKFFSMLNVFLRIITGNHTRDKHVLYVKGKHFRVECLGCVNPKFVNSDTDGNVGPKLPLEVDVIKKKIKIIVG